MGYNSQLQVSNRGIWPKYKYIVTRPLALQLRYLSNIPVIFTQPLALQLRYLASIPVILTQPLALQLQYLAYLPVHCDQPLTLQLRYLAYLPVHCYTTIGFATEVFGLSTGTLLHDPWLCSWGIWPIYRYIVTRPLALQLRYLAYLPVHCYTTLGFANRVFGLSTSSLLHDPWLCNWGIWPIYRYIVTRPLALQWRYLAHIPVHCYSFEEYKFFAASFNHSQKLLNWLWENSILFLS